MALPLSTAKQILCANFPIWWFHYLCVLSFLSLNLQLQTMHQLYLSTVIGDTIRLFKGFFLSHINFQSNKLQCHQFVVVVVVNMVIQFQCENIESHWTIHSSFDCTKKKRVNECTLLIKLLHKEQALFTSVHVSILSEKSITRINRT